MIAQTVAELLADHVRLTVEGIDRMYLNVYVPRLQCASGAMSFFRDYRGQPLASSALMSPMSRRFVAELDRFVARHRLPVVLFRKGQRKDDVMVERLRQFQLKEGVVFVGKAQEKAPVFRTEKRHSPYSGRPYPWIVKSTATVNHYCIYAVDGATFSRRAISLPDTPAVVNRSTSRTWRIAVLSAGIRSPWQKPKERTVSSQQRRRSDRRLSGRHHPGTAGEIIAERRATSNRIGGRHHSGFAGDFTRNQQTGSISPHSAGHRTTRSISARNTARRVVLR
jgi:hypothetical protein